MRSRPAEAGAGLATLSHPAQGVASWVIQNGAFEGQ
jgi:hypothetical protein